MLLETQGGETLPDESIYNTYPLNIFQIYPNGEQRRVRGIYIVGTPHQTLMNIIRTSNETGVFNGFCGAESGLIAAAEIAPYALVNSLEVNRIPYTSFPEAPEEFLKRPKY